MSKIIIHNWNPEEITDREVVEAVLEVVKDGRISGGGKSYCYRTRIGEINIQSKNLRGTDTFIVSKEK